MFSQRTCTLFFSGLSPHYLLTLASVQLDLINGVYCKCQFLKLTCCFGIGNNFVSEDWLWFHNLGVHVWPSSICGVKQLRKLVHEHGHALQCSVLKDNIKIIPQGLHWRYIPTYQSWTIWTAPEYQPWSWRESSLVLPLQLEHTIS